MTTAANSPDPVGATSTRPVTIATLTDLVVPEQPVLTIDGTQVIYVRRSVDAQADRTVRAIWRCPVDGGAAHAVTRGPSDTTPRPSPDGRTLAFLRSGEGAAQLWRLALDGGEPEQLTHLPLGAGAPAWSPDGRRIAFTAPVDTAADAHDDDAAWDRRSTAPVASDRLDYQADGLGLLRGIRMHVHVLDVASGECRQMTEGDWHAQEPAWSPDGSRLAFAATIGVDDLALLAPVFVLDVDVPAATPRRVGLADGYGGTTTWPHEDHLLVVGHPGEPSGHAGLFRVSLSDGSAVDLAAPLDRNVMPGGPGYPGAAPVLVDSGTVLFCVRDRGCTHLYSVDDDGPRLVLGGADRVIHGMDARNGTVVVALTTRRSFGRLVAVDLATGRETVLGASDDDHDLIERTARDFTISDGTVVQGWLVRDPAATGAQPVLLDIHGGPHNAWNGAADDVHLYHQELARRGWTVLLVNPRGSDGYGSEFFRAAVGAWGVADAADLLEPLDILVAEGLADPDRLAVTGYSYGGYLTCYLTSRDRRFAAAVAGGVVSDLATDVATCDVGHFLATQELRALPWADTAAYRAMSPMTQVESVRTPTLVYHGADDVRCDFAQAQQWHAALRAQGVATRLVAYPGASHLFIVDGRPSHRTDVGRRVVDWVQLHANAVPEPLDAAHWQRRLDILAERHGVVGATLGILRAGGSGDDGSGDDDIVLAAHGVLNKDTGVEVTTDSAFQIGSISKVWTATVVMQLVDEGLLDLDRPVHEIVPELRLADPDVTEQLTMRHLLTHTSGIDGDVFTDTGRGDDCLERYVAQLGEVAQNHPLGATWSYCNSGYVLIGRVIEKITGGTWDAAIRERLFGPLGLQHAATLAEDALLHRSAVGHVASGAEPPVRAPVWQLPRSLGPAGLIVACAEDVLAFARMHLHGGATADGTRVLGATSVEQMAAKHADLPDRYSLGDSWGLGWIRFDWDGHRLIGHDGNTIGQSAFLRLLPERGLAVTLLTNGGRSRDLYEDLYREIFASVAGVAMPYPLSPPDDPVSVDITRHLGRYDRASVRIEVLERDSRPVMRTTLTGPLAELVPDPVEEFDLVAVDDTGDLFVVRSPEAQTWTPVTFYSLPTGEAYLHHGVRASPKVST